MENFLVEEYKALWDYYKKTLDERKNLFDWFLLIITLPSSLIGYFTINKTDNFSLPEDVSGAVLLLLFLIGFSLFITYVIESRNAENYLIALNKIRDHIRQTQQEIKNVLIIDQIRQKNTYVFKIDIIKFSRSFIFILIY